MLGSQIPQLRCLRSDNLVAMFKKIVNRLLVLLVDERGEVDDASPDEREAPKRNKSDQAVREKSCKKDLHER